MRESWNWTREDLEKLMGQAETIRLDFKQSKIFNEARERIAANLTREVSAFANTEGGTIVIGIGETKEGKARLASFIDEGVEIQSWPPERLQQLIESNISPYLTGLRIRPIPLDETKTKFAYVVYVPQGSTAYQASDYRYYGRSEYQSKALPDHEVRLRMFRGKTSNAVVRIADCIEKEIPVTDKNAKQKLLSQSKNFIEVLSEYPDTEYPVKQCHFNVLVENVGEINISEFKVKFDFTPENPFELKPFTRTYKEGWPDYSYGIRNVIQDRPAEPMHVNIYPQDTYKLTYYDIYLHTTEHLSDKNLTLNWTLYLSNTLPIQGQIDIADEFDRQKR